MPTTRSIGLAFEKLSVAVLRRNSFDIEHCGRTGDKGIDFKGHWVLLDKEIPVIGMNGKYKWLQANYDYVYNLYSLQVNVSVIVLDLHQYMYVN